VRGISRPGRLSRILVAVAVAGIGFGVASVVQADIPDNGVIHGCYGKPGTPQKGQLRVRDSDQGEQCRFYENNLDWNQIGPTGVTGPTGPTGPQGGINATERQGIVNSAGGLVFSSGFTVTHPSTGNYTITYPPGTWAFDTTNFPAFTGTPLFTQNEITFGSATLFGDGSLVYNIFTGATDSGFSFVILQHKGPNTPGTAPAKDAKVTIQP
jgi:hypothetical protein